jgi:hypothetical protein
MNQPRNKILFFFGPCFVVGKVSSQGILKVNTSEKLVGNRLAEILAEDQPLIPNYIQKMNNDHFFA